MNRTDFVCHCPEHGSFTVTPCPVCVERENMARLVWRTALGGLDPQTYSRAQLCAALLDGAATIVGLTSDQRHWIASRGLAWSGYGGGV